MKKYYASGIIVLLAAMVVFGKMGCFPTIDR
jgi:hypothetical protein